MDQPVVCSDQAEPCLIETQDDPGDTMCRGRAEQDDSHSSSYTINTRQPQTIQWAVARYVPIPIENSFVPLLITNLGVATMDCQAELECSGAKDEKEVGQAEHCHDQAENGNEGGGG